jgi:hypothetical protein
LKQNEIITAIEKTISYTKAWYIGTTDDPVNRRKMHDKIHDITVWHHWKADSEQTAFRVQSNFIQKGMKGVGGGGGSNQTFVYIFI